MFLGCLIFTFIVTYSTWLINKILTTFPLIFFYITFFKHKEKLNEFSPRLDITFYLIRAYLFVLTAIHFSSFYSFFFALNSIWKLHVDVCLSEDATRLYNHKSSCSSFWLSSMPCSTEKSRLSGAVGMGSVVARNEVSFVEIFFGSFWSWIKCS
jgi:hypothetical protein